jgi:hypothetical protein
MENQKKVQSVESVNNYWVTLCIQGRDTTNFMCISVLQQLLLDSASVAHQFMLLIIPSIKKLF